MGIKQLFYLLGTYNKSRSSVCTLKTFLTCLHEQNVTQRNEWDTEDTQGKDGYLRESVVKCQHRAARSGLHKTHCDCLLYSPDLLWFPRIQKRMQHTILSGNNADRKNCTQVLCYLISVNPLGSLLIPNSWSLRWCENREVLKQWMVLISLPSVGHLQSLALVSYFDELSILRRKPGPAWRSSQYELYHT